MAQEKSAAVLQYNYSAVVGDFPWAVCKIANSDYTKPGRKQPNVTPDRLQFMIRCISLSSSSSANSLLKNHPFQSMQDLGGRVLRESPC